MSFRPLYDRILVKRLEADTKTAGGIILPESAQEKPTKAKVVAVGKGSVNDQGNIRPLEVKVGDVVMFASYSGTEVTIDGEEHLVMKESEVVGIFN